MTNDPRNNQPDPIRSIIISSCLSLAPSSPIITLIFSPGSEDYRRPDGGAILDLDPPIVVSAFPALRGPYLRIIYTMIQRGNRRLIPNFQNVITCG
ncbi:hypothetical protein BO70DRAFT_225384 [Aspergillus heteromorphus CBS 117.55]|uniref:Uncharacterized protein n=1 Tax=Aspergillus heteromorphus CBS 117.55 TaxID=1448321 RepID=A0A317WIW0_9EURO|nr:uncharacterized protein BO70DRAFT_225384 [Aspergillus heteromorphus CBS 117.55]PWY86303.1 hypothetical protein BO70DRAFT_225384 [Aspergillus heteromorphus CBS 117.55]